MSEIIIIALHTSKEGIQILYDALEYKLLNTKSTEKDQDAESILRLANEWELLHAIGDVLNKVNGYDTDRTYDIGCMQ